MKTFFALLIILSLNSCKTAQKSSNKSQKKLEFTSVSIESGCLKGGECSFTVMSNKSMALKTEESTGMMHPTFQTDSTMNVVKFKFEKNTDKRMMDAQYREEVYFEVPKDKASLNLSDKELSKVHFLYGRFCYCKGSAGYFKVQKGNLKIEKGNLSFEFENGQVPQKLGKVEARYE